MHPDPKTKFRIIQLSIGLLISFLLSWIFIFNSDESVQKSPEQKAEENSISKEIRNAPAKIFSHENTPAKKSSSETPERIADSGDSKQIHALGFDETTTTILNDVLHLGNMRSISNGGKITSRLISLGLAPKTQIAGTKEFGLRETQTFHPEGGLVLEVSVLERLVSEEERQLWRINLIFKDTPKTRDQLEEYINVSLESPAFITDFRRPDFRSWKLENGLDLWLEPQPEDNTIRVTLEENPHN